MTFYLKSTFFHMKNKGLALILRDFYDNICATLKGWWPRFRDLWIGFLDSGVNVRSSPLGIPLRLKTRVVIPASFPRVSALPSGCVLSRPNALKHLFLVRQEMESWSGGF
ncbi:hypothetical protein AHiyo8_pI69920 (plasmid) [Arthrobacter sp. Hiyo8]|nr:hypothetical protein AHiyo8_pI69920 [Arthrobacter sp. Hiyo8]